MHLPYLMQTYLHACIRCVGVCLKCNPFSTFYCLCRPGTCSLMWTGSSKCWKGSFTGTHRHTHTHSTHTHTHTHIHTRTHAHTHTHAHTLPCCHPLFRKIQEETLRTYIFTYGDVYDTLRCVCVCVVCWC